MKTVCEREDASKADERRQKNGERMTSVRKNEDKISADESRQQN